MAEKVEANPVLGRRIRLMRNEMGLTQEQLSEKLGFANRQTLQQLEADERKLTIDELTLLLELSGRSFNYFTDPFLWDGDGRFSYRAASTAGVDLDEFEQTAGNWVMLWRWLHSMNALDSAPVPDFGIRVQSSYETVRSLSEKLVRWLKLGEAPARSLGPVLEAELGIPVLYVDIPAGVSGATCHFDDGNVILVNRNDSPGRRNFDLAHEFFHVLTWERMPPERIDRSDPETTSAKRREELADNFASALLMPEQEVLQSWTSSADLRVNFDGLLNFVQAGATHFHVSSHAFIWRLVALGKLQKNEALSLIEEFDRVGSTSGEMSEKPPYFSKFFFEQLAVALDEGKISVRRAAKLLALNVDELAEAYLCHDLVVPFDL